MAEKEVKHAGLGIDLNINGLSEFKQANEVSDRFINRMHELSEVIDGIKGHMSSFGPSVNRGMTEATAGINKARSEVQAFQRQYKDIGKYSFNSTVNKDTASVHKLAHEVNSMSGTKLADVKGQFGEVNKQVQKSSEQVNGYSKNVDKSTKSAHRLRDVLVGSFVGTALSSGLQSLVSHTTEAIKQGYELAEGGERIRKQWGDLGFNEKQAKAMTDEIGEIRSKSDFAGSAIDAMQKKFYAMTGSAKEAKALTDTMSAFGAEAGKSGDQVVQLAQSVAKVMGNKTVSSGFFNRAFGSLPALRKQVVAASGMTNDAFNDALKNSKITGDQLEKYMMTASKKSGKSWKDFAVTTAGKMAGIKGTYENVKASFSAPIVDGISKAIDNISKKKGGLASTKASVLAMAKGLGSATGKYLEQTIEFLVKNQKPIASIAKSIFSIGKSLAVGAWKPIQAVITAIGGESGKASKGLNGFSKSLASIAKQKGAIEGVGSVLVTMFVGTKIVKGISATVTALKSIGSAAIVVGRGLKTLFALMMANPFVAIVAAIVAVGVALVELYKHFKPFRKFVNGIASGAKKAFQGVGKWFGKLGSSIGKGLNSMKKATSSAFKKISSDVKKRYGNVWKDVKKLTSSGIKTQKSAMRVFRDVFTGDWKHLGTDTKKLGKNMWKTLKTYFKSGYDFINDLTDGKLDKLVKLFSKAWKSIKSGWHDFWNGISDWFGSLWSGIAKHAQNGINDIIGVLNGGISGIDKVISAFGGSSKAIGTIGKVHFATGTGFFGQQRRAITKPTMAVLNDGHDSPETGNREMLLHPNGMAELLKGTNITRLLEPGAEVLNASETKFAMSLGGMSRFAKGTGLLSGVWDGIKGAGSSMAKAVSSGVKGIGSFASKAWSGATHLLSTIQKIIKSPGSYLTSLLGSKASESGTILSSFSSGMFNGMKKQAKSWWSSLWSMADNVLQSAGAGGAWLHTPGLAETNGFGAARSFGSHDGVDFSGSLGSAIKAVHGGTVAQTGKPGHGWPYSQLGDIIWVKSADGYQEIYQEFGDMGNIKVSTGDTIKTGQTIATLGKLNGSGSGAHVHIGVSKGSVWDHGGSSTAGWLDVTKMHGKSNGNAKQKKQSSAMDSLIKSETGGMMAWIKKHLAPLMDTDGGGDASGGTVSSSLIRKAASMMGVNPSASDIATIENVIQHESGGSSKAVNNWDSNAKKGTPSKGILQFIDPTFNHYAVKGHKNIYSALDQLLAMFNDKNWRSDVHTGGWGPTGAVRRQVGGPLAKNQLSVVGEDGWEFFQPESEGKVIPHDESVSMLKGTGKKASGQPIQIDARTSVTIQGSVDNATLKKLEQMLEQHDNEKVKKFQGTLGGVIA